MATRRRLHAARARAARSIERRSSAPARRGCSKAEMLRSGKERWKVLEMYGVDELMDQHSQNHLIANHVREMPELLGEGDDFVSRTRIARGTIQVRTVCHGGRLTTTISVGKMR